MKKLAIILLLIVSNTYCQNKKENVNCSSFKIGKYRIVDNLSGITDIERTTKY